MPDRKPLKAVPSPDPTRKARPPQPADSDSAAPLRPPPRVPAIAIPDDDLVIVPPPSPEDFLRKPSRTTQRRTHRTKSTGLRQTLVPLLLTHGVFLPLLGTLWFFTELDSPFRRLGVEVALSLIGLGAILLILGVLNALQLRHMAASSQMLAPGANRPLSAGSLDQRQK